MHQAIYLDDKIRGCGFRRVKASLGCIVLSGWELIYAYVWKRDGGRAIESTHS